MDRVENIVAKGEIAHYNQIRILPQCFQKMSAAEASKGLCMWERVNNLVFLTNFWKHVEYGQKRRYNHVFL